MMRVVFVAGSAAMGGTERNVLRLAGALQARGTSVEVVLLSASGPLLAAFEARGIPIHPLAWSYRVRAFPAELARLQETLGRCRPDLVHSYGYPTIWWGTLAALRAGAAARVIAIQAWDTWKGESEYRLDRATSPAVHLAIADGEGVRQFAVERYGLPAARTRTLYDGADPEDITPRLPRAEARASLGICPADRAIGVVARLDDVHKGQAVLLETAPQVLAARPEAVVVLVGDGSDRAALETKAAGLGITGRVRFAGTRNDLGDVLSALDLLVIPSRRFESVPKILVEGMAAGLPIVATRVGDIPELLEDRRTGRLVPAEDPAALAAALLEILGDADSAAALGGAAREAIARRGLTLEGTAERLVGLYRDLCRERSPDPPRGTQVRMLWAAGLYLTTQALRTRRRRPAGAKA